MPQLLPTVRIALAALALSAHLHRDEETAAIIAELAGQVMIAGSHEQLRIAIYNTALYASARLGAVRQ